MSSAKPMSRVSYRNIHLQSFYQLDTWWMFSPGSSYSIPWQLSHLLWFSISNHLQPTKSVYMEPVQVLNLNRRYISGLEPQSPVHIRTWTSIAGAYQGLNLNRRYITGLETESTVHIRTWTWIAGTYQGLKLNRRYISGLEPETLVRIRTWTWIACIY